MHARHRTSTLPRTGWLPLLLLLAVGVVVAWRLGSGSEEDIASNDGASRPPLVARTGGGVRVSMPAGWTRLDHAGATATWGSDDRLHTVTVASVEASVLPLPGVVAAVVRDTRRDLPGVELEGRPVPVALPPTEHAGDAAMLARFTVPADDGGTIHVAQVWRRDTRAHRDVIATWTSSDGRWPAPPRATIPSATGTR